MQAVREFFDIFDFDFFFMFRETNLKKENVKEKRDNKNFSVQLFSNKSQTAYMTCEKNFKNIFFI